jgi:hypothetical protein
VRSGKGGVEVLGGDVGVVERAAGVREQLVYERHARHVEILHLFE